MTLPFVLHYCTVCTLYTSMMIYPTRIYPTLPCLALPYLTWPRLIHSLSLGSASLSLSLSFSSSVRLDHTQSFYVAIIRATCSITNIVSFINFWNKEETQKKLPASCCFRNNHWFTRFLSFRNRIHFPTFFISDCRPTKSLLFYFNVHFLTPFFFLFCYVPVRQNTPILFFIRTTYFYNLSFTYSPAFHFWYSTNNFRVISLKKFWNLFFSEFFYIYRKPDRNIPVLFSTCN